MTDIISVKKGSLPAFAKNRTGLSETAKALAGNTGGGGKRISIKAGVFRLIVGGKEVAAIEERHLDVVIVAASPEVNRTFYAAKFDEKATAASAPDCWSPDGKTPDPTAKNKQSDTCLTCPKNAKGSGQGESRACRHSQRIAVALANDIGGDVLQLVVPGASIWGDEDGDNRPLKPYARYLATNNVDPEMVVTRIKFDTKASAPKLFFKAERWLTDDEHAVAVEQAQSEDAKRAITMTVAQTDGVESQPAAFSLPKPAAKKVKAEESEVEEPTVRKEATVTPAAAVKKDVKDLVAAWDADD